MPGIWSRRRLGSCMGRTARGGEKFHRDIIWITYCWNETQATKNEVDGAVSEMSLGPAKVGLSKTDRSAPTYTHDIMYFRFPRKLPLKWLSFWEESPYPVVRFGPTLRRNSSPPRPSTHLNHLFTLDTLLRSVGTRFYCPACKHRENDFHQAKLNSLLAFPLFIISKVGAILAQIDVESLNALSITDLKNICNFRLCSFSCRKSK